MGGEPRRKPLLGGRGVLRMEDFCRSTGLDQVTVENLMRTERLEGALWWDKERTRPFGIHDDVLPARQTLAAMGLPVRDDYEPDDLRTFDMPPDDDDDPDAE